MSIAYCNTVAGMHARAKELGINAYSLGCSCYECNKGFDKMLNNFERARIGYDKMDAHDKEIWNAAIEQAAKCVDRWTRMDQAGYDFGPAMEIRKLKK